MPTDTSHLFSVETVNRLVVEPVFATSVALASGLTRITTNATRYYVPVVSGGSASWPSAELTELADAGVSAEELEVTPKRVATLQVVSNQAADDAGASELLGRALVAALADECDRAFFAGAGPSGPTGLAGVTGNATVSADPGAGLDAYVDAIAAVEEAGGQAGAIYLSPTTWADLSKVKQTTGSNAPVLSSPTSGPSAGLTRTLLGVPVHVSRHVGEVAWVADAARALVVMRADSKVDVDRSAKFTQDGTAVRATMRIEFAFPYPATLAQIAAAA